MIQIVGPRLNQWDTGRKFSVTGSTATHAHLANRGDSHAVIMVLENGGAKIPDFLLQTGKELYIYLVQEGVTQERDIFPVQKRERPENYVYEDDRRNYIYELITDAQAATEAANQAAAEATNAAQTATQAATNAAEAANSAIAAAGRVDQAVITANLAAENANEAAAKAEHTAKALMIVGSARGNNISLDNAIGQFLVGLRICGKTTQNGTPTPTSPVDLVSVGSSGSITVNIAGKSDSQSMTIATPSGLPGIPVSSGGNYTDANGQQWICDEIDLERGVLVRRVGKQMFDGSSDEAWSVYDLYHQYAGFMCWCSDMAVGSYGTGYCDRFPIHTTFQPYAGIWLGVNNNIMYVHNATGIAADLDGWKAWLSKNHITVQYILATPIETPLSAEELAAYAALHTYRGNTTVTNDAGAHMELEYVMDAKKYIDSQISAGILAATVE